MDKFESFACGQIFHSFPNDKNFAEIIALCEDDAAREAFNDALEDTENEDQQLHLCERYENEWWENVPGLLGDMADQAEHHFS